VKTWLTNSGHPYGDVDSLGLPDAAAAASGQSRLVSGLQHPLVMGDDRALADGLRRLAPTYERLRTALASRVA